MADPRMSEMTEAGVTRAVLEQTPNRAFKFLSGVGATITARDVLELHGYTAAVHDEGWRLLRAASERPVAEDRDPVVVKARARLNKIDERTLTLWRVGLSEYPALRATVLDGLQASDDDDDAFRMFQILVPRIDALATHPDGPAAIARTAVVGFGPAELDEVRALLVKAEGRERTAPPVDREAQDAAYVAALVALRRWFDDWSAIAKLFIRRRRVLIRMGLATPRGGEAAEARPKKDEADDDTDVVDPTPFLTTPKT